MIKPEKRFSSSLGPALTSTSSFQLSNTGEDRTFKVPPPPPPPKSLRRRRRAKPTLHPPVRTTLDINNMKSETLRQICTLPQAFVPLSRLKKGYLPGREARQAHPLQVSSRYNVRAGV